MSSILANMGLVCWPSPSDQYNSAQQALNWQKVDNHDHSPGKGKPLSADALADGIVTAAKIGTSAVTTGKIFDGAVTTPKLTDGAVTASKLGAIEAVRLVGGVGQPAFQNSYINFIGPEADMGFWKDLFGYVHLQGMTATVTPATVFTLPTGYRPADNLYFPSATSGSTIAHINVKINGDVVIVSGASGVTFNGIYFRTV